MALAQILFFSAVSALVGLLASPALRRWLLLIGSLLAIYWMQPSTPIRHLDFWLPTTSVALAALVWAVTRREELPDGWKSDLVTALVMGAVVILIAINRYIQPACCLIPSTPPAVLQVLLAVLLVAGAAVILLRLSSARLALSSLMVILVLVLFILLKTQPVADQLSAGLRLLAGQSAALASGFDIRWLGFSYVAFRLIHTLRDRITGRLPAVSLQEFITYIIFFPAYTSGPIDRIERFTKDLRRPFKLSSPDFFEGSRRIITGIFLKFVLADSLALVALNGVNANQVQSPLWLWVMLYAYAFRLYFDFAGYTSIAIGLGILLGIRLPENFDRPYLKQNLTAFWNSWHMSLAQWFRAYFFNPITRALRSGPRPLSLPAIILIGQVGTMVLIGLWHGITWNFLVWGLWHGIGLFVHNRWAEAAKARPPSYERRPWLKRIREAGGTLLTFHYVALGWVWFALPTPALSLSTLGKLFGG